MSIIDQKYVYNVNIDPNPIYSSISQLNIAKIMQYLKSKKVSTYVFIY